MIWKPFKIPSLIGQLQRIGKPRTNNSRKRSKQEMSAVLYLVNLLVDVAVISESLSLKTTL